MEKMAETAKIYGAICGIMAEIGAIGKDKRNAQQGFNYRGVDDVMNALQPLLCKHNVFVVPRVVQQTREERQTKNGGNLIYSVCSIEYTFYADDGSSVTAVVVGEGMDSGDKSCNKAMAVAFKYACFQVFCIPTEEMRDPDGESHETRPKAAERQSAPMPAREATIDQAQTDEIASAIRARYPETKNDVALLAAKFTELTGYKAVQAVPRSKFDEVLGKCNDDLPF